MNKQSKWGDTIRTKFDCNEIVIYDNYAEIILYDVRNNEKARAIIDVKSVSDVASSKWYQRPDGYVATNKYNGAGYAYLHNILLQKFGSDIYGDHIDGNRLNNKLCNLREATPSQNGMNKRIRNNNTSGRVGVHWSKTKGKWCAMIGFSGKHLNLGYFDDFENAIKAREDAECKYFKEYTPKKARVKR